MAKFIKFSELNAKAQTLLGVLTIVFGFYMMWGSLSGKNRNESTLSKAAVQAIEIDTNKPSTKYIGKLVVAAAMLKSSEQLEDEFIKPGPVLILQRRVKMYQWVERLVSPTDIKPQYSKEWVEGQADFLSFQEPSGHENPVLKYDSKVAKVSEVSFGGYDGSKILGSITVLPELPVTREMLKDPTLKIENGEIYLPRNLGSIGPSLGDMKISYQALPVGDYTIAARQADEVTLIGGEARDEIVIKTGILSSEELFTEVGNESKKTFSGLLYLGGAVFFIGAFSTLVKLAPTMDLRPKLEVHGKLAVLIVSGGITVLFS
jgi:hypothetical protein